MKRIAIFALAMSVAGVAAAATDVFPLAKRTWGQTATTVVFNGTGNDGPNLPACVPTVRALGAIGHGNAFGHEDNIGTMFTFNGQEILDALAAEGSGARIRLEIQSNNNSTLQHTAAASLVKPDHARTVLDNNGVFPALGVGFIGNDALNVLNAREQTALGVSPQIPSVGRCSTGNDCAALAPLNFNPLFSIPLGGNGGGTLDVCLGPTGQVRIIDPGNNSDWASECVAGGWRPEQISLGAGSPLVAAAEEAVAAGVTYTTYQATCGAAFSTLKAGPTPVANPVTLLVYQPEEASMDHRVQTSFPGFTNFLFVQHQAVAASTKLVID